VKTRKPTRKSKRLSWTSLIDGKSGTPPTRPAVKSAAAKTRSLKPRARLQAPVPADFFALKPTRRQRLSAFVKRITRPGR
jgi:hypothetical protein